MQNHQHAYLERLTLLYSLKIKQADKVKNSPNSLMYKVLKAEAEAIDYELKHLLV